MTTMGEKYRIPHPGDPPDNTFPELPPRDDMQNPIHLYDPGHPPALRRHFGSPDTTIVLGEIPLGWRHNQGAGLLKPDLLIAFNIDRGGVISQEGYSIEERGKPPDFVLEVASKTTSRNDYTSKREGYANYGVPEYWRFDPSGGQYYPEGLAGDRLVEGVYVPVAVDEVAHARYWGYSSVLGLYLCWENGRLRLWDPVRGEYILDYDESEDARLSERAAREAAEARQRSAEARQRSAEARQRSAEARQRSAEAERDSERAARQAAEAELERLREQLER